MKEVAITGPMEAREFDARMLSLTIEDDIALHLSGLLSTKGVYRWGRFASRNLGRGWTVDGDAEISIDPSAVADRDNQPLFCLAGPARSVTGITVKGNHSVLAKDWPGSLRTGGVLLYGQGKIDDVTFKDFGASRAPNQPKDVSSETFVAEIIGSGAITNSVFTDYNPATSDDQVTVFRIMGSENGEVITDKLCLLEGNTTTASGVNQVQALTLYWTTQGLARKNTTRGVKTAYYADWAISKNIEILENDFEATDHGVQIQLAPGYDFSHENYTIGPQRMVTGRKNVCINTLGPMTATRFIRGIKIDASLTYENFGGEITITGLEREMAKGCNPFRR